MRALLLLAVLSGSLAGAEEAVPLLTAAQVRVHLDTYFHGEQLASIPFATAGAGGVVAGVLLVTSGTDLGRSAGWVNVGFGALELIAGAVLALTIPGRLRSLEELLAKDPAEFARAENARVTRIRTLFQPALLAAWAAVGAGGGVVAGVGAAQKNEVMLGLGLGFAVQGLVMFLLDWAVLDRANGYGAVLGAFKP